MDITGKNDAVFRGAEIVVALEHADTVAGRLAALGIQVAERQDSEPLGLARLCLDQDGVKDAADQVVDALPSGDRTGLPESERELDRLLWGLRRLFAAEYAGWAPTLGKNRLVGSVEGGGRISHGGDKDPQVAEPPTTTQEDRGSAGLGTTVGVLDTAVANEAPLAGGWVGGADDVLLGKPHFARVAGHGTFVTGLIRGHAPGCVVRVRKVLDQDTGVADAWTVAQRIVELGSAGLDVLNLSLLCFTEDDEPPLVLATAIDRLDPHIVVVAAAGNHGDYGTYPDSPDRRRPAWPAALDDVIAVGAAHRDGSPTPITPRNAPWIDVCAPGMDVLSTYLSGSVTVTKSDGTAGKETFSGWARWTGSSFAAALVSGAIAARTVPGRVPARQAWECLRETAEPRDGEPPFLRLMAL